MENKYDKLPHRLALSVSVSFFFVYTLLFYGPVKLYVENKDVLWFNFSSTLTVAAIISVVAFLILTLLTTISKRAIHAGLCCIVFALALGLFIQGNFMNINYGSGVLDGSEIAWKDYTTYGAINSAIWSACLAMPFAFYMVFRTQWRRVLIFTSLALIVVEIVILSVLLIQNSNNLHKITYEVTREGIYELSDEDNTIVFLLDSFDEEYIDVIKEAYPDYEEKLSGFTEYDNTLATSSAKSLALPSILSGKQYTRQETYQQYINDVWKDETVYSELRKNGVDTRIYAQTEYFSADAKNDINNLVDYMDGAGAYESVISTIYKYTAYTYMPHYLKQYFWLDLSTISSYKSNNFYTLNDAKFYSDYVRAEGFTYSDDYSNAVRIYNLDGANAPYNLTKNTIKNIKGTSLEEQITGCFNCLFTMIDDLKANNKYKNATIIITANTGNKDLKQHPVLLIKEAGKDSGYKVSSAPLSSFDLAPTLASLVTENYSSYGSGNTYYDFDADSDRERYFYLNTGENNSSKIEKYSTEGTAVETTDFTLTNTYNAPDSAPRYRLGTPLTFAMDATANAYTTKGFCATTGWSTSLAGPHSQMVIPISSIPKDAQDVHVYFGVSGVTNESVCTIYANGVQVFSAKITKSFISYGINFTVPKSIIESDNKITLDFKFNNISEDELELETNKRTKTVSMQSFKMYTQ